jgi:hypothetical protein
MLSTSVRTYLSEHDWLVLRRLFVVFDSLTFHVGSKAYETYRCLSAIGMQPLKIRLKASHIYDMINLLTMTALRFVAYVPQLSALPLINRHALLIRHTRLLIMYYVHYQMNLQPWQQLTHMPCWLSSFDCLLLHATRRLFNEINVQIGTIHSDDPYLIELIMIILALTPNSLDDNRKRFTLCLDEYRHTTLIHRIQNDYINLTWNYML